MNCGLTRQPMLFILGYKMKQLLIQKVRWLQQAEGHRPCFRSGNTMCSYKHKCCFYEICDVEMIKATIIIEVID